jgi:hypothetical protein
MSDYFQHSFISNSDIKSFKKKMGLSFEDPLNLQEIYDFGTLFHATILEPHLSDKNHEDYELALKMRDTFWKDPVCRAFAMASDFEREQPFYNDAVVGPYKVKLRAKCDGVRRRMKVFLELKGLGLDNDKAFRSALVRYNYDQAASHYAISGDFGMGLIVGISKKDPTKLFKWWMKRYDDWYLQGEQKLIDDLTLLREFSPEDIPLAA